MSEPEREKEIGVRPDPREPSDDVKVGRTVVLEKVLEGDQPARDEPPGMSMFNFVVAETREHDFAQEMEEREKAARDLQGR